MRSRPLLALMVLGVLAAAGAPAPAAADEGSIVVAVLDSGIDPAHPEFAADQVVAWKDFVNGRADPYDDHWHGTAVASRVAGATLGAAPGTKLAVAKVLDAQNRGWNRDFIAGVKWAVDEAGADVVSVSVWNGAVVNAADVSGINDAIRYAHEKGVLVVWIAGNGGQSVGSLPHVNPPPFPSFVLWGAGSAHALVVGAAHADGRPASFSNDAPEALARGVSAPIAFPRGAYGWGSGTSFAAPFVAGAAARVLAADPALSPAQVEEVILKTARDDPDVPYYEEGYGNVDDATIRDAEAVARGDAPLPSRPADDAQHAAFTSARIAAGSSWRAILAIAVP